MRLTRFEDLAVVPWRNGGGVTREVAARRDAGAGSDFLWRLSIATVNADGPFSSFVGTDRTIAVLAGRGIALRLPDRTVPVTDDSEPFSFAGEAPVHASVMDGETTDLNAMTRRGWFTHRMRRLHQNGTFSIAGVAAETVVVFGGRTVVEGLGDPLAADRFDALVGIAPGQRITVRPEPDAPTYLIEFFRSRGEQKDSKERPETPMS
ncbi:hypothetical protein ASC89_04635 [Devosia sp. Root413D1]|uniref:HutD/Ves family protein n=1 Tax=Devosia sp. Root413D1 TaxID=1736531 RepID=UPI00070156BB|nr:HutD family protein [Devosia sp. Root413D1]KQW81117.1 hypothetical protein ASC89_04635 [Devosia sp. Root413D1]